MTPRLIQHAMAALRPPASVGSRWLLAFLVLLQTIFAGAWLLSDAALYAFAARVAALIGHWPRPSVDDPKFVAPGDWLCDLLYMSVIPLWMLGFVSLVAFPALTWLLLRQTPRLWTLLLTTVFILSWLLPRPEVLKTLGVWYMD